MDYKRRMNYGGSVDKLRMAFGGQVGTLMARRRLGEEGVKVEQGDPQGGKVQHGLVTGNSKFRVIPMAENPSNPNSPIRSVFFIDGREVEPQEFAASLPEGTNINKMIEQGTKDAGLRYDKSSGEWQYAPKMSGDFKKAMEEKNAYLEGGDEAVMSLYDKRTQAANDTYYMRGGGTGPDRTGSYTPQPLMRDRNQ